MRRFLRVLAHEWRCLWLSPASYVAGVLFLLLLGLLYWAILRGFTLLPQEQTPATQFFRLFWIPVFFVVPLLTMRGFAEERRTGMLERTLTTTVRPVQLVLAKFGAVYGFYLLLWAATLLFPWIAVQGTSLEAGRRLLYDLPSLWGGLLFVAVSGLLFLSLGLFCSSLSRSQLVSAILSFTGLFLVIAGSRLLLEIPRVTPDVPGGFGGPVRYLQVFEHLLDFSAGIVDTRPFLFYLSGTVLFLFLTTVAVARRL